MSIIGKNTYNVCHAEKRTKHSSILLLRLVHFSAGHTLLGTPYAPVSKIPSVKRFDNYLMYKHVCQKLAHFYLPKWLF